MPMVVTRPVSLLDLGEVTVLVPLAMVLVPRPRLQFLRKEIKIEL
jgi:hypothetical protein